MFCSKCGKENLQSAKFCRVCGKKLISSSDGLPVEKQTSSLLSDKIGSSSGDNLSKERNLWLGWVLIISSVISLIITFITFLGGAEIVGELFVGAPFLTSLIYG